MRGSLRMIPLVLLGSAGIAYVLARPTLASRIPHLDIWEFPVGAILVTILLWAALATRRATESHVPWRRHEQVVRDLADPVLAPDVAALERYVRTGDGAADAARIIARARTSDRDEQGRLRAELARSLSSLSSRRKREHALKNELEHGA